MKIRKIKKIINRFQKHWKIIKEQNIKIRLAYDDPRFYIGMFSVLPYGKNGETELFLNLNAHWFFVNDKRLLNFVLKHELVHIMDHAIHGGFREDKNGELIEHDEFFDTLCELVGIKNESKPFFPINRQFRNKKFKNIPVINLQKVMCGITQLK